MELTVLGCSGSFGGVTRTACSGYLVRSGSTSLWMDCGNGTLPQLQAHVAPEELTGVVITHEHPDHCVDVYGLHVLLRFASERTGMPVYAPRSAFERLGSLVGDDWGDAFCWEMIEDGDHVDVGGLALAFSRTDHPPPTYAVEVTGEGRRIVYTSDTGPGWSVEAFAPEADLVVSEATYLHDHRPTAVHLSARQAGSAARAARARRLVLTHLWPSLDARATFDEGSTAFGEPVIVAEPHLAVQV